ncbi:MFS transporter [Streptomyces sp. NBC_00083]|uniref:MFS transporter n=1 Tax=Streptomyces sp. NBC_00083 TaxID=2975647 RepID=UPI002257EEB8|nr:MFS transporter [Streptomyces sp. NBC_00083]MCX5387222.1 MFS transporter [Streptomyces sp. NBC_00083]
MSPGLATAGRAARRPVPRDVRLFWWANASDALGTQASGVVLPLLLLGLGHSAAVVGLVAGVSTAAGLLLAPLAAVPADRGARKPVMFWSATVSALAMAGVAAAAAVGNPPLTLLLGAVLVERFSTAVYEAAAAGTVAMIAPPADCPRVVAGLSAGEQGALILGPALGGALYQVARALPFLADAVTYAVAAGCVRALESDLRPGTRAAARATTSGIEGRKSADAAIPNSPHNSGGSRSAAPEEAPVAPASPAAGPDGTGTRRPGRVSRVRAELGAGLALVRTSPTLRLVVIWTATVNGVIVALYYGAVFTLQKSGHGGWPMGLVLALSGAAGLAGSLAAPRIAGRFDAARLLVTITWLLVPLAAGLATAEGPWTYGALFGAFCLLMPLVGVVLQSRALQETPPGLQARTGAVLSSTVGGSAALAPVLAGVAVTRAGTAAPAVVCAGALAVLAWWTTVVRARLSGAIA